MKKIIMFAVIFIANIILILLASPTVSSVSTTKPSWSADGWKVDDMPNPQIDINKCGRDGKMSFVCDPIKILTSHEADDIDYEIEQFCQALPRCLCDEDSNTEYSRLCTTVGGCSGIKIAVAVVPNIHTYNKYDTVGRDEVSKWAKRLRTSHWKFGTCEDNVVIVLSKNDRQVYTSTGTLARNYLSDECVDTYYKEVRNYLTQGDYGEGIRLLVNNYRKGIAEDKCKSGSGGLSSGAIAGIFIGSMGALVAGVLGCVCCCSKGRGSGSGYSSSSHHHNHSYGGGWFSGGGGGGGGGGGSDSGGGGGGGF